LRIFPKAGHWPQFETPEATRRQVAAYLGLPRSSEELYAPVDDEELVQIEQAANFLAHSDVGNDLNLAQRMRIAAQCHRRVFKPGEVIAEASEKGDELFIIQEGTVEVYKDPDGLEPGLSSHQRQHMASLRSGQITGELAMLDQGERSADLVAGRDGATVLVLERERLLTLCEDDAVLGTRLLWNIAQAMSGRVRYILWQLNRAEQRRLAVQRQQAGADETLVVPVSKGREGGKRPSRQQPSHYPL
jgi:CRP-like cAMP-binding protein